jgi:hypothetical protein
MADRYPVDPIVRRIVVVAGAFMCRHGEFHAGAGDDGLGMKQHMRRARFDVRAMQLRSRLSCAYGNKRLYLYFN